MANDYSHIRGIRDDVFPTFGQDQVRAADELCKHIAPLVKLGEVSTVVDLGCGTGEVLDSIRIRIAASAPDFSVAWIGLDCCTEEIDEATRTYPQCRFLVHSGEALNTLSGIEWEKTLLMSTGHTIPHFHPFQAFVKALNEVQPAFLLIDRYHTWDRTIEAIRADPSHLSREPRRIAANHDCYILTTEMQSEDNTRVTRGIERLNAQSDAFEMIFETSQERISGEDIVKRFEDSGYIPEYTFKYDGGYGRMHAVFFSRVNTNRSVINEAYFEVMASFAAEVLTADGISDTMAFFDTKVVAAILPFDPRHTFAKYVSIKKSDDAPADLMYLAKSGAVQDRYPTAYGLYMALLAPVSSSTVIPLTELEGASFSEKDEEFSKRERAYFARCSQTFPEPNRSFFVVPFYFADLPLFCAVLAFTEFGLPSATTSHEVYVALLENFANLVRQKISGSIESGLIAPLYWQTVSRFAKDQGLSADVALKGLKAALERVRLKKWKSWLLTISSRCIKDLAIVAGERERLDAMLDRVEGLVRHRILERIALWFRWGRFFGTDGAHVRFEPTIHLPRLAEMLKLLACDTVADLRKTSYFGATDKVQEELAWLSNRLGSLVGEHIGAAAGQAADEAFRDLKSVFCRTHGNKGTDFRFGSRRIRSLCSMYHPGIRVDLTVEEPNVVPMSPDPTPVVIGVVRQVHHGKVSRIMLTRVSEDCGTSTVRLRYSLHVELGTGISLGTGSTGGDCQQFLEAVGAFDPNWKVETGKNIRTLTLGFELIADEKDGEYTSLEWDRTKDRFQCDWE